MPQPLPINSELMKRFSGPSAAFTLIELLITIAIVAILSVGLAVNFRGSIQKAHFDDEVLGLVHILEQARSYSLTNFLISDTEPADYYLITVSEAGITLEAHGATLDATMESVTLSDDFSITDVTGSQYIYYFPPTGLICLESADCTSTESEVSFTLVGADTTNSQVISLNKYGGAPEVEE